MKISFAAAQGCWGVCSADMAISIAGQLALTGWAFSLGLSWGLLFDLLRQLRRHCREGWQRQLLDVFYCLVCGALLILFALRCGGEVQLYMLCAMALGLLFHMLLISPPLQEVWCLWAESGRDTARLLALPGKVFHKWVKKAGKLFKKHFHFYVKCYIIKMQKQRNAPGWGAWRGRGAQWHKRKKAKSGPAR